MESERGFNNIEGHQQLFSEFVASSLLDGVKSLSAGLKGQIKDSDKWKALAERFGHYGELVFFLKGSIWLLIRGVFCTGHGRRRSRCHY